MNAIIVAAGIGRRLMPITKDCPKCLLKVGEKRRIIDLMLEVLGSYGVAEIVMVVGYHQEKIRDYLGRRMQYVNNPIYDKTNSMYSLWCAQDYFGKEFLYLHSDIVFERSILKHILSCKQEICLAVDEKIVDQEDMKVRIKDGLICAVNKSVPLEEASGEFIGIAKFRDKGIRDLKQALNRLVKDVDNYDLYFEYAIEYLIKQGHKVYPSLTKNRFYAEIDSQKDLKRLQEKFSVLRGLFP